MTDFPRSPGRTQKPISLPFKPGDVVEKVRGYKWPGVVVASFATIGGERRVVVECTVPEVAGALHIYSPDQLRVVDKS